MSGAGSWEMRREISSRPEGGFWPWLGVWEEHEHLPGGRLYQQQRVCRAGRNVSRTASCLGSACLGL